MFRSHPNIIIAALICGACSSAPGTGGGGQDSGVCGNGIVEAGEECDVGGYNADNGVCKTDCTAQACGDGQVGPAEECDLGTGNSDELPNTCRTDCQLPACGDGVVDDGEACDDGPANSDTLADACRTTCTLPRCGDGVSDTGEGCDDGVRNSDFAADACRSTCVLPSCGDGVIDEGEACDDGPDNSDAAADACRTTCQDAQCGDGVVDEGEICDDGPESSDTIADACRTTCRPASCGDGVTDSGETCDRAGDAADCDSDCTVPSCGDGHVNTVFGEQCDDSGESATCNANCRTNWCGDGIVNVTAGEECDVGSVLPNAACTLSCKIVCQMGFGDCTAAPGCETDLYTSGSHCGTCGHSCGGGVCSIARCQPIKISDLGTLHFTQTMGLKEYGGDLYTSGPTGLARISAGVMSLTTPTAYTHVGPHYRAYSFHGTDIVFYAYIGTGLPLALYTAPIGDPTATPTLLAAAGFVPSVEADTEYVYTAPSYDTPDNHVALERASLTGTPPATPELVGNLPSPGAGSIIPGFDMIVTPTHVYVTELTGTTSQIWRMDKDPSDPQPTFVGGSSLSLDIADDADFVYWTTVTNTIARVAKDPFACLPQPICPPEDFVSGVPNVLALSPDSTHLYWVEGGNKAIRRKSLQSGVQEDVRLGLTNKPTALLVVGNFIYWMEWLEQPAGSMSGQGYLWKLAKP